MHTGRPGVGLWARGRIPSCRRAHGGVGGGVAVHARGRRVQNARRLTLLGGADPTSCASGRPQGRRCRPIRLRRSACAARGAAAAGASGGQARRLPLRDAGALQGGGGKRKAAAVRQRQDSAPVPTHRGGSGRYFCSNILMALGGQTPSHARQNIQSGSLDMSGFLPDAALPGVSKNSYTPTGHASMHAPSATHMS